MQSRFNISADLDTPVSTYMKLGPLHPRFLLESVEKGTHLARYSFLGFGAIFEFRLDQEGLRYAGKKLPRPKNHSALLEALREALELAPKLFPEIDGLPFSGGLVGAAGYDIIRNFEFLPNVPQKSLGPIPPEINYIATESLLVFDHLTRSIALLHSGEETDRIQLIDQVKKLLAGPIPKIHSGKYGKAIQSLSSREFKNRVDDVKNYITKGDIYQLVLSVRFSGTYDLDPFQVYRALRLLNPSPYMFYFDSGELQVVGSSPEALVRLHNGDASLRPIAGTRPRSEDSDEDLANERSLLSDEKEIAEHVMLVDLARNDLGRVAISGSINVSPYQSVERYSHVMHIVSGVNGKLADDKDAFDLFAAAFPAGTLVGAPKVRAMQLIDSLEPESRGLYAGTVGYFGCNGDMDQAITIRTLVFQEGHYSYQAGAGIVADSQPEYEYKEVLAKSEILRRALAMAEEGL
ncbi:MAG: anthranilate synthase component I family protein [Pseudomonadota bacterium]|nr:anthranilate synthase component I family protein [Pseudomonadota bacterium]